MVNRKRLLSTDVWPIDLHADLPPPGWHNWPANKQFSLVLTHDVETAMGQEKCYQLMELEKHLGFRSVFNFVPERYDVSAVLRQELTNSGFEVGVHGLCHDGKLYNSRKIFSERAARINRYLKEWDVVGFRSPAMHRNLDWIHDLNIMYDASTFDTDPFEPHSEGVGRIYPFRVIDGSMERSYIELPYTLPQDFTLFILMQEENMNIWKLKLDWIVARGGMVLINTHPDYMNFGDGRGSIEEYPVKYYREFLEYIKKRYYGQYWHVLPKELATFWSEIEDGAVSVDSS